MNFLKPPADLPMMVNDARAHVTYDNLVIRALLGHDVYWLPLGGINASHYAQAQNALDDMDLVTTFEDMGKLASHLCYSIGWACPGDDTSLRWLRRTRSQDADQRPEDVFTTHTEILRHHNRHDNKLWQHAREIFAQDNAVFSRMSRRPCNQRSRERTRHPAGQAWETGGGCASACFGRGGS
eukprot:FR737157.1.p1 GENE.FR737157.1~~FR737157.1.p1  ORF type:complete len:189 (+),score=2.02 FR737157.1:22-567(+)